MKSFIVFILLNFLTLNLYSRNVSHFRKVVWIIFENENFDPVFKQADFAKLAGAGVLFTQMTAESHPSQPNYVAMIAGSSLGVSNDKNVELSSTHLGDLLEKSNKDWRVYAEGYPGNCFQSPGSGSYVRKHIPFLSFSNVIRNPARCAKIMNEKKFFSDLDGDLLPEYTMYVPDLKNDGHDTGIDYAGMWLTKKFGDILSRPEALKDTLFVITFDESDLQSKANQIYTVLIGKNIIKGSINRQRINHYSLLKMIEDELQLGNLGRYDASAPAIENIWNN